MRRFLFSDRFILVMKFNWFVFLVLFLIGFAIFFNGLAGDFVHDDLIVLSHSFFSQPERIFNFFSEPYFEDFYQAGLYRPLTQFSLGLNFLFSSSTFGFHFANVLLHVINSFFVFLLLKKLSSKDRFSLVAALLFLVLPIHVEAVTSIVGRAELLSFFFGILTLLLWFDSKYFLSAITLFLALSAKENAVAAIAIVFLFGLHYRRNWRWLIYYFGVLVLYFGMRIAVLGQYAFQTKVEFVFNPLAHVSFFERFWTALKVLTLYLIKTFVPYRLSADYSYDQIPVVTSLFSSPLALVGLVVLGLMLWAVCRVFQRKVSLFVWALIFFFLPYLVISNLIFPTGTIMAERLMYFSSLGVIVVLAVAVEELFKLSKKIGLSVLLVLTLVYGFLTISQNRIWASREALLADIFKKSSDSVVAKTEYGVLILDKDRELAKKLSLEVYEKYPDYVQNLNLRAAVEVQEGDLESAQKFLERALELRPKHQNTLQNLSRVYFTLGKYQKTEEVLKVLVSESGGKGNVIFYALVQAKNRRFAESHQTLYSFFGPEVEDESALKILRGDLKELEEFFRF